MCPNLNSPLPGYYLQLFLHGYVPTLHLHPLLGHSPTLTLGVTLHLLFVSKSWEYPASQYGWPLATKQQHGESKYVKLIVVRFLASYTTDPSRICQFVSCLRQDWISSGSPVPLQETTTTLVARTFLLLKKANSSDSRELAPCTSVFFFGAIFRRKAHGKKCLPKRKKVLKRMAPSSNSYESWRSIASTPPFLIIKEPLPP
jgi:hypothetical protein